jgi:hypothetical protein
VEGAGLAFGSPLGLREWLWTVYHGRGHSNVERGASECGTAVCSFVHNLGKRLGLGLAFGSPYADGFGVELAYGLRQASELGLAFGSPRD